MAVLVYAVLTVSIPDRWAVSALQIAIFALAVMVAIESTLTGRGWPASWLQFPLFAGAAWGLVQLKTDHSAYRFATWLEVLNWTALGFVFVIGLQAFTSMRLVHRFRRFGIYFGALVAIWAILQLFSSEGKLFWVLTPSQAAGVMGPFVNPDHYSAYMELLLPLALWEAVVDRRRAILFGCLAAVMYASVIAGASRAGSVLINLELGAVLIPALTRGRMAAQGAWRILPRIALLVLIFSAIVGWDVLLQRFQDKDPFSVRREAWISGIAMIRDHPWIGCGLGAWTTVYPHYAVRDVGTFLNAAHSDWLQWAGEGGIPFLMLMLLVAARALQLGLGAPWALGITCVFLHCLVDFPLQQPPVFIWLLVMLAAAETARTKIHFSG